ncbi:hypothetical protein FSARC_14078 [Fusarium sarcochroum]|uniref:Zn(2)-C6 fungal-type domain-containing protein n=1 Tax=Fusarium sarcochroum TaxID=1208366 RepID=A0A8H4SWK8_9HYPO|nr:hypothetical protein FSARC_14078 [Fusarium sarcochroum]
MSNSSLLNLTDIVSRKCDTHSLPGRLPSLGDDVPTAWIPMTNDSYGGMTEVCSPNSVNLYGNCVLWCELPAAFMDSYEDSGSDSFSNYFRQQLRATGMNMSQVSIYSAKEESAAPVTGHPPRIMALGTCPSYITITTAEWTDRIFTTINIPDPHNMPRKGIARVRTGCLTCKARRVKCDETKPRCSRCVSAGRKCDGYPVQRYQKRNTLALIIPKCGLEIVPSTPEQGRAIQYYRHVAGPALAGNRDRYFWTNLVLQAANLEPAVRHSIITISLLYEYLDPTNDDQRFIAQEHCVALTHYNAAILPFYFGERHTDYPDLSPSLIPLRHCFESLDHASSMMDEVFVQVLYLFRMGENYRFGRYKDCPIPDELLRARKATYSLLEAWRSRFRVFADQASGSFVLEPLQRAGFLKTRLVLLVLSYHCQIGLDLAFEKDDISHDNHTTLFQQICQALEDIAGLESSGPTEPAARLHDLHVPKFTFETGLLPTLSFCILKCRHLETRLRLWRLLPVLCKPQESLWQLSSMIVAQRRLIEMQHGIQLNSVQKPNSEQTLDSGQEDVSTYSTNTPPDSGRKRGMCVFVPSRQVTNWQGLKGSVEGFIELGLDGNICYQTEFIPIVS